MSSTKISESSSVSITRRQLLAGASAAAAFQQLGCASSVPGGNGLSALSGKSLQVTLTFRQAVNSTYFYFFLINASNSSSAPGPIPVGAPIPNTQYGNGFATGSDSVSGGFTDFVLFSTRQYAGAQPNQNFALYHVADGTNANTANFVANGVPLQVASPQSSSSPTTIGFQLDLAQLFTYPNSPNNQSAAITKAHALRWIQVNVVSTNVVPTDIQTSVIKMYDSFGNDADGVGSFQLVDLNQSAYANGDQVLSAATTEPANDDVFISPPVVPLHLTLR